MTKKKLTPSFSIVTATYNCSKYLDKYFKSILTNNYDLNKIELIIVDDGSTDDTKEIINCWIMKYPNNIKYIYQENQGQSIARNKGLEYVKNEWVTFIDSDDFISENYFKEVVNAINISKNDSVVSTNWINYIENEDKYINNHPLKYKFDSYKKVNIKNVIKNSTNIQLAMNSTFFNSSEVKKNKLLVRDIKPQFEDAVFIMEYFKVSNNYNITFSKCAKYYYRKRSDKSSTLNKAQFGTRRYVELLNEGYVYILSEYKEDLGYVPEFVQNTVIYDLSWNIKELESNKIDLTKEQKEQREKYLKEIFKYIEFNNIIKNWKYLWKMYQIGINYKYYDGQEKVKAGIYLHYQTDDYYKILLIDVEDKWEILLDNRAYKVNNLDNRIYIKKLNNEFFTNKRFVKIPKHFSRFEINYDGIKQRIPNETKKETIFNPDSLIIFYDRENKADDNAEVMYEWMQENHPEYTNMYFALNSECKDYERLKLKGFKLLDYGSEAFERLYIQADYILSSGFSKDIENYKNFRYNQHTNIKSEAKFVFLQHGIITDDLSEWFSYKRVDKVITTANFEYENLIAKYTLFKDQVILSGLPRFDKLYSNPKNEILVQFTWRMEYQDYDLEQMKKTKHFQDIVKLLTDNKLKKKVKENGYIIKFIPHPEVNKHLEWLKQYEDDVIKVLDIEKIIFRDEFARAKLMITDYSSVFCDFTYLRKPVIYYQENSEQFYKYHLYKAEMNYEIDGLGSVECTYRGLINKIIKYIYNDCKLEHMYKIRIENFFKYSDQNNCKRLFDELVHAKNL